MDDLAFEQVRDGREADVRMRPNVDALARRELGRTHVIEEDEGPDEPPRRGRQEAPHHEAAEVTWSGVDDAGDRGGRAGARASWIRRGPDAHLKRAVS